MSRSSVAWWPDSGATTSTVGWLFSVVERGGVVGEALEAEQLAERLVDRDLLLHRDVDAVDLRRGDVELGLLVVLRRAGTSGRSRRRCAARIGVCANGDSGWL